jgi:hypothetical protein
MTTRDYSKELGMPSTRKTMPRALAYVILAIVAAGVIFAISQAIGEARQHHEEERAAASPAPPPSSATVPMPAEK